MGSALQHHHAGALTPSTHAGCPSLSYDQPSCALGGLDQVKVTLPADSRMPLAKGPTTPKQSHHTLTQLAPLTLHITCLHDLFFGMHDDRVYPIRNLSTNSMLWVFRAHSGDGSKNTLRQDGKWYLSMVTTHLSYQYPLEFHREVSLGPCSSWSTLMIYLLALTSLIFISSRTTQSARIR